MLKSGIYWLARNNDRPFDDIKYLLFNHKPLKKRQLPAGLRRSYWIGDIESALVKIDDFNFEIWTGLKLRPGGCRRVRCQFGDGMFKIEFFSDRPKKITNMTKADLISFIVGSDCQTESE